MAPVDSSSLPSAPGSAADGLMVKAQRFFEENQKAILIGCGVAVAAGAGYYIYSSQSKGGAAPGPSGSSSSSSSTPAPGEKSTTSKNKKKKKNKKSKFIEGEGTDGPLLEEIKPKPSDKAVEDPFEGVPDAAGIAAMSESERNALGKTLKDRGNKLYSKKDFKKAVECYTKAIEISVQPDAVFYSNRAACYVNYSPPEFELCVQDCDEALNLDRTYVKALKRRATALERLDRDEEAVRDFTACTIIERFQDEAAATAVERCLKKLSTRKAKDILASRETKLPSPTFISSYLAAFREHPKPKLPENPSEGDKTLDKAFDALEAADYTGTVKLVNEAIEQGISTKQGQAEAYNLRGTFKFLIGDSNGAKTDLEKSLEIDPTFVQSWVKIASVHMELGDALAAFADFETAIRNDPNDPDIYYHRGQVFFIMGEHDKAIADYNKSIELDDSFIFTHVQAAVAQYKQGEVAKSMAAFRKILRQFPERGEPSNYYGEILLDQQKYAESVERFERSIELDKDKKPRNVLPYVNKALALFQWKQDIVAAEALCKEALDIDADCDVAVATLAQLSLQQGKIDEAINWFEKSGQLARTEGELINAITYEHASRAQAAFLKNFPDYAERLGQIAQGI
ncbi:hypothetical protein CspeluHIS016_0305330 [Cutaneotrichosporon spelunceum]|uniref:Mitochondrial outer membrane translocase receptor TOM70 n=1 Tax=Cutaneotrichosporon spelunceum TaxID=1672016 RepID=A0AAD3YC28_9TREE|nr:hypothetical protein CspeluHIS016_0305330 [Cutaneotrichosporon spelunceum]